jgi:hypothetical protein
VYVSGGLNASDVYVPGGSSASCTGLKGSVAEATTIGVAASVGEITVVGEIGVGIASITSDAGAQAVTTSRAATIDR